MDAHQIDLRLTPPRRSGMLKLCACNAVPGTATRESGWSSESRVSNGLGSRDSGRLGLLGKASRNRDVPRLTGQSDRLLQMKGATPRKGEPRRGSRMVPIRGNGTSLSRSHPG